MWIYVCASRVTMVRDSVVMLLLLVGYSHAFYLHRSRGLPSFLNQFQRTKDILQLQRRGHDPYPYSRHSVAQIRNEIEHLVRMRNTDSFRSDGDWFPRLELSAPKAVQKRLAIKCDNTRITIQTILEYLRSGRICGFRVTTVRFGLGGRR